MRESAEGVIKRYMLEMGVEPQDLQDSVRLARDLVRKTEFWTYGIKSTAAFAATHSKHPLTKAIASTIEKHSSRFLDGLRLFGVK